MKARAFRYARPKTISEAVALFESGGDACYIAGGQSLVPALALRLQAPDVLIDIAHIASLRGVELQGESLRIGALTRHCEVLTDPLIAEHAPLFREAAPYAAHPAIRNRGTIGGSISHADPASEFPAMALAMRADFEIVGRGGVRRVPADEFFIDLFQTAIEPGEILVAIHVPIVSAAHRWAFQELSRRRGDFAIVGLGIFAELGDGLVEHARIVFFGVGNTPVRAHRAEEALIGRRLDQAAVLNAQSKVDDDLAPPEDESTPPSVRMHLARVILGRSLTRIMGQA